MDSRKFRFWPVAGQEKAIVWREILSLGRQNISYKRSLVIGFPGTDPDHFSVKAMSHFLRKHPNNICTHTSGESEKGFQGTQEMEKRVIFGLAELLGGGSVDGYIAPGGTEANIMGMLLARESLKKIPSTGYSIFTSIFGHYSIRKAAWVLGLHNDHWENCGYCSKKFGHQVDHIYIGNDDGTGVNLIGTDNAGRILVEQLEREIRSSYSKGIRRFIIFANAGTTMTGGIDDTEAIGGLISKLRSELSGAGFYLHVDAAFGGLIIPFLYPDRRLTFEVPEVDSVTVDFHKTGVAPYPAGCFIYRRDDRELRNYLGVQMGYVPGGTDGTLCGSRPGASAAACYAVMRSYGYDGFREMVVRCMQHTDYLLSELKKVGVEEILPNDMNIIAFRLPVFLSKRFREETMIVFHHYPADLSSPSDHVGMIYKCAVMPHVDKASIGAFIKLLRHELTKRK